MLFTISRSAKYTPQTFSFTLVAKSLAGLKLTFPDMSIELYIDCFFAGIGQNYTEPQLRSVSADELYQVDMKTLQPFVSQDPQYCPIVKYTIDAILDQEGKYVPLGKIGAAVSLTSKGIF